MDLSVVTTMYRSAAYLREFHARTCAAAAKVAGTFEIVFVDDGSPDESLAVALEIQRDDPRVRVVELSRNFGHHPAMLAGLAEARGERVLLIDCDLEEPPETLLVFDEAMKAHGVDVVYGVQAGRKGGAFDRLGAWAFYRLYRALSTDPLPENVMTVRLMTRPYVEALCRHGEVELLIGALWVRTGFKQIPVAVDKARKPTTTYDLTRKINILVNAITSSSNKPLVFIFWLGSAMTALSVLAGLALLLGRLFLTGIQDGWASVMVSVWLLGGLSVFCQGVLGIYLSKIFIESKRRPRVFVRAVHERPAAKAA